MLWSKSDKKELNNIINKYEKTFNLLGIRMTAESLGTLLILYVIAR